MTTDNPTRLLRNIGVTKVSCNGQESVFHNCKLQNSKLKLYKNEKVLKTNIGNIFIIYLFKNNLLNLKNNNIILIKLKI